MYDSGKLRTHDDVRMRDRQCILLVDDDPAITEGLAQTLQRPGRTSIVCSDVESAEISLNTYPVTHLVTDVQFSGEFGYEGLHFLNRVRILKPECRIVLISGQMTDTLSRAARSFGAAEVLAKPFETAELEQALDPSGTPDGEGEYEIIRFPPLEEILISDELVSVFHPILRLGPGGSVRPFGYEALARVRGEWLTGGPAMLFEYAERRKQLADLNLLAVERSIRAAASLPGKPMLFVNVDPMTFTDPRLAPILEAAAGSTGIALCRLVLEVTERTGFGKEEAVSESFDALRRLGLRFALDDLGSAYSHLGVIGHIAPSFIKVSQTFGTEFEKDDTKTRVVRHVLSLARDFGCETVLEGVESAETAQAAAALGVELVQGFHFGRPASAASWS